MHIYIYISYTYKHIYIYIYEIIYIYKNSESHSHLRRYVCAPKPNAPLTTECEGHQLTHCNRSHAGDSTFAS